MYKMSKLLWSLLVFSILNITSYAQVPALESITSKSVSTSIKKNNKLNKRLYRTIDGTHNDYINTQEGSAHSIFRRKYNYAFYDGDGSSMINRGNPRSISNSICHQEDSIPNENGLSALVFTFLQFIDHDITATEEGESEYSPIKIPKGDIHFDPNSTGNEVMPFTRVHFKEYTGTNKYNPRQQINTITSWIDASMVYGSDKHRAAWLRSFKSGKLKSISSKHGELLPYNTIDGYYNSEIDKAAPFMQGMQNRDGSLNKVFVAGDVRANEQVGLTSLHTLFLREHNRICDELITDGYTNDEYNYQLARKIVGGIIQSILYNELLPAMGIYTGSAKYKQRKRPDIFNSFSAAAFRLGHTMLSEQISIVDDQCNLKEISLKDAFFNLNFFNENKLEDVLRGLSSQSQEKIDVKVTGAVRNFLFGQPGSGGLDLATLNIQRARDHGIADFNKLRSLFGLRTLKNVNEISSDQDLVNKLLAAYGNVNNIDPWIGLLAEDHMNGKSVGPTLNKILTVQFRNLRQSDRFYYLRDPLLSWHQKNILSQTKLADIINRNTNSENLQDVFHQEECSQHFCKAEGESTNYEWIKKIKIGNYSNYSGNDFGYADFSERSPIIISKNTLIPIRLKPAFSGNSYREYWTIWIDYNQNRSFEEDEILFRSSNNGSINDNIIIPATVPASQYRMRIAMKFGSYPDACASFDYGEVEDFTISVNEEIEFRNSLAQLSEIPKQEIKIFPNPAKDFVEIEFYSTEAHRAKFVLIDAFGKQRKKYEIQVLEGINSFEININDLVSGYYFFHMKMHDGTVEVQKLVVSK